MSDNRRDFSHATLRCDHVISIDVSWDDVENWYVLTLVLGTDDTFPEPISEVRFLGIRDFCLESFGGGITQFNGLKLEDDTRGFDGVRYRLIDHEDNKIRLLFWDFEVS